MFYHGSSWKDLRSSNEESHIVKIEKPNEKDTRRESGAAPQGSAGQGGIGLFQAVGYLTGEMEEYRSWLEGRQMSRDEAARPGQGAGAPPGLDWGMLLHLPMAGPSPKLAPVSIMYPTIWISMISEFSTFHWF